jgi:secreted trypsin-like serine protease
MHAKPSCRPSALSDKRLGAIARRSAILLSGTAAIALTIAQPASAIVVSDQVAPLAAGGIANYFDGNNQVPQFPNVVSLFSPTLNGSGCTGSLINSRTILTAAHCFDPNSTPTISFAPTSAPGVGITSFVRRPDFVPPDGLENDIAVISLAQPVTNVQSVRLLTLQPGQPGFPTTGTTITMVGYGTQGTGSSQVAVCLASSSKYGQPSTAGCDANNSR